MIQLKKFTLNPFAENTYIIWDETRECVIVDPGCSSSEEEQFLSSFIEAEGLKPTSLLNTHCHIDHVFGNAYMVNTYELELNIPAGEEEVLKSAPQLGKMFGVTCPPSPAPDKLLREGEIVTFGDSQLEIISTPGHSPASVCFHDRTGKKLISGDVLFLDSIGRTDLPGGNYQQLMESIRDKILPLPSETMLFPGHGPSTNIANEQKNNPFLAEFR